MRAFPTLIWIIALLSSAVADAARAADSTILPERPLFRILGSQDGLPSSTQMKLAHDRDGNLWVATQDGLARYDGVAFKVWRHDPQQPDSLPGNDIQSVVVDDRNQVWAAVQDGGFVRYRPDDDRFDIWRHDPAQPEQSLSSDRIWTLASDNAGGVWFGGFDTGLGHLDQHGRIRTWRHDPDDRHSLCENHVYSLAIDGGGTIWIGGHSGLCRFQPDRGFQAIPIPGPEPQNRAIMISSIQIDDQRVWLSTSVGMRVIAIDGSPLPLALPAALTGVASLASTLEPDGTVWLASSDGIRRWNPVTDEIAIHRARPGRALNLQSPRFMDVVRDREGSLWFASFGGGLAQLVPRWRAVRVFLADPDNPAGLPTNRVQLITLDHQGKLWVVTDRQSPIAELDPTTGLARRWFPTGSDDPLPDRYIMAALRDRHGRVWTTHRGGFAHFDPDTGRIDVIDRDDSGAALPRTPSRVMAEHPDHTLFATFGGGGIVRIDIDTLSTRFDPLGETNGLPCAEIYSIHIATDGAIWLACDRGLLKANGSDQPFTVPTGSPTTVVDGLDIGDDGDLWLHSDGRLNRYRVDGDALEPVAQIGLDRGWPPVRAGGIVIDGDGVAWATTARGLFAYDPTLDQVESYDQNDGLPSAEFSDTPPVRIGSRYLAAGTMAGPVVVDTRALREPLSATRLRWYEASVVRDNQRIVLDLSPDQPLRLQHDDRDLHLSVRLNSHVKPSAHRYRFWLQGFDQDWVEQTGQPERRYERLGSGQYVLEVQALTDGNLSAVNALRQVIEVSPPPWRQPWAYLMYVLLGLLLAYAAQRAYRHRLLSSQAVSLAEERQQWAEQANNAKTRFLADIGHEIRTPMAGLLGMNDLLLRTELDGRQRHYARDIRRAGTHMLNLINDLLDLSRIEAGKLKLDTRVHDIVILTDEVISDVAAQAENKKLVLSLRIEPDVPLSIAVDGKRLKQILLNFLANAIKFTECGHVRLHLSKERGQCLFAVEDEGAGLSEEIRQTLFNRFSQDELGVRTGGAGLGLAISRELATLMGGEVGAENRHEIGSRFWLRLPLVEADGPMTEALDLPLLLILDADSERADDLATSLRALAASVEVITSLAQAGNRPGAIVLLRTETLAEAESMLAQRSLSQQRVVLGLPLGAALPPRHAALRVLSGPWRLRELLTACRNQSVATISSPGPDRSRHLSGMHLLLVEDDAVLREVMSTGLASMGATISQAETGLTALARMAAERVDAVLLDLDLPQLDGLQVLGLAQRQLGDRAPPFIVVTARQQPDDEARCREAGAIAFYRKPVDLDELARRLNALRAGDSAGPASESPA